MPDPSGWGSSGRARGPFHQPTHALSRVCATFRMDGRWTPRLWIGALAERTGVSTHVLRVWEERYGLLTPERSPSGYRLYGPDDERRVREMVRAARPWGRRRRRRGDGARRHARTGFRWPSRPLPRAGRRRSSRYDEAGHPRGHRPRARRQRRDRGRRPVVLPVPAQLGDEWEVGRITVAQEHFGSGLIRGRMLALAAQARDGRGRTPRSPCSPARPTSATTSGCSRCVWSLRREGWSVTFLGADTPIPDVVDTARDARRRSRGAGGHRAAHVRRPARAVRRRPGPAAGLGTIAGARRAGGHGHAGQPVRRRPLLASDPFAAAADLGGVRGPVPVRTDA